MCFVSAYAKQLDGMLEKKITELTQLRGKISVSFLKWVNFFLGMINLFFLGGVGV